MSDCILLSDENRDGFFISDCNAIEHFCGHNYTQGRQPGPNVHAALVVGGVDYNCGSFYRTQLLKQVQAGFVNQTDVDRAVRRVLKTMMKLGMFDPLEGNYYASLPPEMVDRPEARQQSLEAATKGIVPPPWHECAAYLFLISSQRTDVAEHWVD